MVELGAFWFKDYVVGPMLCCSVRTGPLEPWKEYSVSRGATLGDVRIVFIIADMRGKLDPTFWIHYEVSVASSSINDSKLAFLN